MRVPQSDAAGHRICRPPRGDAGIWTGRAIAAAFWLLAPAISDAQTVHDGFEQPAISSTNWTLQQIEPRQLALRQPARCGDHSASITVRGGDGGASCTGCQRAELRTHRALWPTFGVETWYGFSFRASGDIPEVGSHRIVLGQWKGPNDDSPFLAQRFDNGVFYLTVQDNDRRMVIASAKGDRDRLKAFQRQLASLGDRGDAGRATIAALEERARRGPTRTKALVQQPDTETDSLTDRELGLLSRQSRLPLADILALFSEFSYVTDLQYYARRPDIEIEGDGPKPLPDPKEGWVDMVYRIRGGRTDNRFGPRAPGEIEVWANGEKIVSVRGNIGYTIARAPRQTGQYFKFGIYRDNVPGTVTVRFDEFSLGETYESVAVRCR